MSPFRSSLLLGSVRGRPGAGLFLVFLILLSARASGGEWVREQRDLSRYEHIWKISPFAAAAPAVPEGQTMADRFAVTGFATIEGRDVVFLLDRSTLQHHSLRRNEESNGMLLLDVAQPENLKTLEVHLRVGTEAGRLRYDPEVATSVVAAQVTKTKEAATAPVTPPNQISKGPDLHTKAGAPPRPVRRIVQKPIPPVKN